MTRLWDCKLFLLGLVIGLLSLPAYGLDVAKPSGKGPSPAVIVLHSGSGLLPYHLDFATALRLKGYITITPKYCFDQTDCDRGDHSEQLRRIADAYDRLKTLPGVDSNRIGMVGFSRGASRAISFAEFYPDRKIRGVVSYYLAHLRYITFGRPEYPPILFLHGELDDEVTPVWIKSFCTVEKEIGKVCKFKIYSSVYHAFTHQTRRYGPSNPSATADAWERAVTFLDKYVNGQSK